MFSLKWTCFNWIQNGCLSKSQHSSPQVAPYWQSQQVTLANPGQKPVFCWKVAKHIHLHEGQSHSSRSSVVPVIDSHWHLQRALFVYKIIRTFEISLWNSNRVDHDGWQPQLWTNVQRNFETSWCESVKQSCFKLKNRERTYQSFKNRDFPNSNSICVSQVGL